MYLGLIALLVYDLANPLPPELPMVGYFFVYVASVPPQKMS